MEIKMKEQAFLIASEIRHKYIKEVISQLKLTNNFNLKNKGHVGHVIEQCFGVSKNNINAPDLIYPRNWN